MADSKPQPSNDSFDKDDVNDKGSNNGEQTDDNLESNGKVGEADDATRAALAEELEKIEAEIKTLKTVLASKQKRAGEIKKSLGSTVVLDMKEKVKNIQESEVILRTNQAFKSAGEKTSAAFSNFGKKMVDVNSKLRESIGSSFNNVKARVNSGSKFERMTSSDESASPNSPKSPTATSKELPKSTNADEVEYTET